MSNLAEVLSKQGKNEEAAATHTPSYNHPDPNAIMIMPLLDDE